MKIDLDKQHPLTSVDLLPEGEEDEYLTEEQTAELKKAALRCVRFTYLSAFFAVVAFLCEFVDLYDLLSASKAEKILAAVGYAGLGGLILSLILVFAEGRKLKQLSEKYRDENIIIKANEKPSDS